MCESVTITLPWPDKRLLKQAHAKGHWRERKAATAAAKEVGYLCAVEQVSERANWDVAVMRQMRFFMPDASRRDTLNMSHTLKGQIDGIVNAGVFQGDDWRRLLLPGMPVDIDRDNPRVELVIERKA